MTDQKVALKHPQNKKIPRIAKKKYEVIAQKMIEVLNSRELTHTELFSILNKELDGKFDGNISWYAEGVKLDLEARKIIERTDTKPQKYRLT